MCDREGGNWEPLEVSKECPEKDDTSSFSGHEGGKTHLPGAAFEANTEYHGWGSEAGGMRNVAFNACVQLNSKTDEN